MPIRLTALLAMVLATSAMSCDAEHVFAPGDNPQASSAKADGLDGQSPRLGYFSGSYDEARARFVALAKTWQQQFANVEIASLPVPSATDSDLTMDTCYIPAQQKPERLLIISSGVHGIEGFVGSAVLELVMTELLGSLDLSRLGVLLIHAVNPWGYRHQRRVTENNVDLNRNFDVSNELFQTENEGYDALVDYLNPERQVDLNALSNLFSPAEQLYYAAKYGMSKLRQAILGGQYKHPQGLYFGGQAFEPQVQMIESMLRERTAPYQAVFLMDLHTGYGERGRLHLFGSAQESPRTRAAMQVVFDGYEIDSGDTDDDFYTTSGDFTDYLPKLLSGSKTSICMCMEYGTLDSQTTIGSMKSLQRMRLENQGFRFGYEKDSHRELVTERFMEMYNPSDAQWRETILQTTADMLSVLIDRFSSLPLE